MRHRVSYDGKDNRVNRFGGQVSLGIVVRAVKMKSMMANYLTVREHVYYKQEGAKHHGVPPNGELHGGQGRS